MSLCIYTIYITTYIVRNVKSITLKSNSIFSRYTLLLNVLLLLLLLSSLPLLYYCYYTLRIIYNILCECVCACVRKRLVVASQWTCCYADALLFRVGWISAACLARLPRPRWPRTPPRFWNLCQSPRTCPVRPLAVGTCSWSRSPEAGTPISYRWSCPCSCATDLWSTLEIPKTHVREKILFFFLLYSLFICIENYNKR